MTKTHVVQSNFLSGVLDPRALGRVETTSYNNGLLRGINIEPVHLGGVRRRRGFKYCATMPNQLTSVNSSATSTAPNGGTAANAKDADETTLVTTTGTVGTTDPFIVVHYDLGAAITVAFADCVGIVSDGGSSTQFRIQYSTDDAAWTDAGTAFASVDTTARSYRRVGATARYWRVVKIGGTDMGAVHITISGFDIWRDSGTVSAGRAIPFEVSTDERYVAVLTDHAITIYSDTTGAVIDRQPAPYASADLADIDAAADAETMMIVHEDYAPRFLVRETTTNFQQFLVVFDAVPQIDYADSSSPTPTSDVQTITFAAGWVAGDTFQVALGGAKTASIQYAGDVATTATNIAREVQKLWTVQGFTGVTCARTGSLVFAITLAGASADAYDLMSVEPLSSQSTATVVHTTTGVARREPVWSAVRGYPRTVEFFEGRLYFGGTRSKQQSIIGSRVNDILHMSIDEGLDDDPVFVTLNGRTLNAVQGLFAGRSLQLFASGGEFRFVKETGVPITPGDAPVNQTLYGAAKIRPVNTDGATIYVQRNRKSIRDFRFDYTENAYNSLGVSALASHLIYDVRDLAAWNGSAVDEISLVLVVNGVNPDTTSEFTEGTIAVLNSRKEAEIQAWTIWTTAGKFRAVATILESIYVLVEREINGVTALYLEQGEPTYYTDCATQITNVVASATATGLDHLNGEECRVRADGMVFGNVTPSAGSATLEQAASAVEVGLDWTPDATPMPLQTLGPAGSNFMRKRRIVKVRAKFRNTLGVLVNGRRLPDRRLDSDTFDSAPTPFTGNISLEETTNWDESEDKIVSFTQVDPLPFELLAVDTQMEGDL